jgi:uncharacterized protein (DUF58 family)
MSEEHLPDEDTEEAQATFLALQGKLTPTAYSLLWGTLGLGVLLVMSSGASALALVYGMASVVLLILGTNWFYGRKVLREMQPGRLEPLSGFSWEQVQARFGLHHVGRRFAARDVLISHGSEDSRRGMFAYQAKIDAGHSIWIEGQLRLPRRGRFSHHGIRIASSFPFGLVQWTASWRLEADILALPRLGALRDAMSLIPVEQETLSAGAQRVQEAEEFHTLKTWRPGMSQRQLHWKTSARRGKLMVRETQGVRRPRLRLELIGPTPKEGDRSPRFLFEQSICLTATLADFFLRRNYQVEVVAQNVRHPFYLDVGRGRTGLFQVLSRLAEVDLGRGNLRQARLQSLDITHPGTRRWFHADRRFSTGLQFTGRSA